MTVIDGLVFTFSQNYTDNHETLDGGQDARTYER